MLNENMSSIGCENPEVWSMVKCSLSHILPIYSSFSIKDDSEIRSGEDIGVFGLCLRFPHQNFG
jgi:hypothetical protein